MTQYTYTKKMLITITQKPTITQTTELHHELKSDMRGQPKQPGSIIMYIPG